MPTKRTPITRLPGPSILTPALITAWRNKDYRKVAALLKLKPWECSPTWCHELWLDGETPCSDEPHRGCVRAAQVRDALNEAIRND